MNEMAELVARAMWEATPGCVTWDEVCEQAAPDDDRIVHPPTILRRFARAALAAMRDHIKDGLPGPVLEAGARLLPLDIGAADIVGPAPDCSLAAEVFVAIIDAALAEGGGAP
jgi:hypothetical protein